MISIYMVCMCVCVYINTYAYTLSMKAPSTNHWTTREFPCSLFSRSVMPDPVTPWTVARQASLSFTVSWSLLKLMSTELMMPSNHLILLSTSPPCHQSFPALGSFPMSWLFASGDQSIGASGSNHSKEYSG